MTLQPPTHRPAAKLEARRAVKLYDRHGTALHTVANVLIGDQVRAEALVVEAIIAQSATRIADRDDRRSSLRQLAAGAYAAWSRHPSLAGISLPPATAPRSSIATVYRLPDDQRVAVALCAFGGHTHRQAAAVLGLPAGRVADLLREALLTLGQSRDGRLPS